MTSGNFSIHPDQIEPIVGTPVFEQGRPLTDADLNAVVLHCEQFQNALMERRLGKKHDQIGEQEISKNGDQWTLKQGEYWVDGRWVRSHGDETFKISDPSKNQNVYLQIDAERISQAVTGSAKRFMNTMRLHSQWCIVRSSQEKLGNVAAKRPSLTFQLEGKNADEFEGNYLIEGHSGGDHPFLKWCANNSPAEIEGKIEEGKNEGEDSKIFVSNGTVPKGAVLEERASRKLWFVSDVEGETVKVQLMTPKSDETIVVYPSPPNTFLIWDGAVKLVDNTTAKIWEKKALTWPGVGTVKATFEKDILQGFQWRINSSTLGEQAANASSYTIRSSSYHRWLKIATLQDDGTVTWEKMNSETTDEGGNEAPDSGPSEDTPAVAPPQANLLTAEGVSGLKRYFNTPRELLRQIPVRYLKTSLTCQPLAEWLAPAMLSQIVGRSIDDLAEEILEIKHVPESEQLLFKEELQQVLAKAELFSEVMATNSGVQELLS